MRVRFALTVAAAAGLGLGALQLPASRADDASPAVARYDDAFWKRWGDGKAEVAGYELEIERYGERRQGTAVAVFVTETFTNGARVKSDGGHDDSFPVLKLNLIKDFATGIYDYNLMTSAFVALQPVNGAAAGYPTKVSFSSQEWCGHVYHQVLFDQGGVREQLHSYFDGEGDQSDTLPRPAGGVSEDALLLWARGLASPTLEPGASVTVPMLGSLQSARLRHRPLAWTQVTLSREREPVAVEVPAGRFQADVLHAQVEGGPSWTFHVEHDGQRRLLRWETQSETGQLLGADRMQYWKLHGRGGEANLKRLGLTPRPPRTP